MQSTPLEPAGGWPPVTEDERQQTTMMWIIAIILSLCAGLFWLSPLIFFITSRDKSKFVGFYAAQALLLGIAAFVLVVILFIVSITLAFIFAPLVVLMYIGMLVIGLGYLVVLIKGMIESSAGRWWEMPLVGEYAKGMVGLK